MVRPVPFDEAQQHDALRILSGPQSESEKIEELRQSAYAEELGLSMTKSPLGVAVHIINALMKSDVTKLSPELMLAAVELLKRSDATINEWTHGACHLFDGYTSDEQIFETGGPAYSLLQKPALREGAIRIIDETVKRQLEQPDAPSCLKRIINPVARYNLHHIARNGTNGDFAFRPESLDTPGLSFVETLDSNSSGAAFLRSGTPGKFLRNIFRQRVQLDIVDYSRVLPRLKEIYSEREILSYADEADIFWREEFTKEELQAFVKRGSVKKGYFFDFDETLFSAKFNVNGPLNINVAANMIALHEAGNETHIISGGDLFERQRKLAHAGIRFIEVEEKQEYRGYVLEFLIDDTEPGAQGLAALTHINPRMLSDDIYWISKVFPQSGVTREALDAAYARLAAHQTAHPFSDPFMAP